MVSPISSKKREHRERYSWVEVVLVIEKYESVSEEKPRCKVVLSKSHKVVCMS